MFPAPTLTLVGEASFVSVPARVRSPYAKQFLKPPARGHWGSLPPQGDAANQSPPPCGFSTAAQESSLSFPLVQLDPPPAAGLGLPTVHRPLRCPSSKPSPDQHLPSRGAGSPLRSGSTDPSQASQDPSSLASNDTSTCLQILLELLDSGPALGSLEACLAELHRSG